MKLLQFFEPILFLIYSYVSGFNLSDIIQNPPRTIKPLELLECNNLNWYDAAICSHLSNGVNDR